MASPKWTSPLPKIPADAHLIVNFPTPRIMHVAIDRPAKFNALTAKMSFTLDALWDWYEAEPALRCAVVGTTNARAWCAGGDLKELNDKRSPSGSGYLWPKAGLGGMGKRRTRKPVIAAVRGVVIGGAVEMLTNFDVVIAGENAVLSLPEAKRGVAAAGGGLPRLVYLIGRQKTAELLMTGRDIPSREAARLGLVNEVVPDDEVEAKAMEIARQTADNSPDAVQLALFGLRMTEEEMGYQRMMNAYTASKELAALNGGENIKEGLKAFVEKRQPRWHDAKL